MSAVQSRPTPQNPGHFLGFVFMHFVYIIFSLQANRFYVGESAFPDGRLIEHNTGKYSGASTKMSSDWECKLLIKCKNRSEALIVERYIKKMKSRQFINSLINDSEFRRKFRQIVMDKFTITLLE